MKLVQSKRDAVIEHVSAALDRLNEGKKLTEEECLQVITDLENLRAMENKNEKEQKKVEINIEELLKEFNVSADDSKKLLQIMLTLVSEGRVPEEEEMRRLQESIDGLRQKYNTIYSFAMAQVAENEMPKEDMPAIKYVEAVRNSVYVRYKKQLETIRKTLEEFVSVQSWVNNYAMALQPFQEQAEALLSRISKGTEPKADEIEQKAAGPKAFLNALTCDDLDSDEGMALLDLVGEFYPRRVQNGLAAGKYCLPEKDDKQERKAKDIENSLFEEQPVEINESLEYITDPNTGENEDDDVTTNSGKSEVSSGNSDVEEKVAEELSEFAKKIETSGLLLKQNSNIGLLSKDISTSEDKKTTASVFQNDVRKGNEKAIKVILKEIVNKNNISIRYLSLLKGMSADLASGSLDYLQRKGYLRKYKLSPGGEFYCASPRLIKSLSYRDAAKMIGVNQHTIEKWGQPIEDKASSAACRILYDKLYCDSVQRFMDAGYSSFTESEIILTECFFSRVYAPKMDSISCDIIIGVFWDSVEECDIYLEKVKMMLEDEMPIKCVIFSSYNQKKAKTLATVMLDELGDLLSSENMYLYSMADNSYYDYFDGNQVDEVNIGAKQENVGDSTVHEDSGDSEKLETASFSQIHKSTEKTGEDEEFDVVLTESEEKSGREMTMDKQDTVADIVTTTSPETLVKDTIFLINSGKLYAATAYAKAFSLQRPEYSIFYNQLAHAVNDPMGHCNYSTDNAFTLIDSRGEFEDALVISTALRTFFSNQVRYDYNIKSYYSGVKEYKLLNDYPALSKVLYTLMDFKDNHQKGMDAYADYRSRSKSELDQELSTLQQDARIFYDNFVIGRKKEKASQKRFLETKKLIFSAGSDFGQYIKAIIDGDNDIQPLVLEFLQENFYKEDSTIEVDTIDSDKLWNYIMVYWDKAGDLMMYRRHADLMSHLRNNIISTTTKAVQLLAKWCDLVSRISNHTEDEGELAYKKVRRPMIDNLEAAIKDMQDACADEKISEKYAAGLRILSYTLKEILKCINGSYMEDSRKYFYVPFLLTDDVMLDEGYLPDLEMHSSTLQTFYPMTRILNHVRKLQKKQLTFRERLTSILDDKGDDYGAARLIIDYLMVKEPSDEWSEILETIDSGEAYAKETADLRKDDFIGNLELAQSYGQIDNSVEDKKEKILQIVDEWYGWAIETSNYGFFKQIMDGYLAEIKEEAKSREKDLLVQLESFKATTIPGLSAEGKKKRVSRILAMINEQNYTVAEDLLARADASEEEQEELIEEDFLKDFLDNYDDYYQPVAMRNASFATLVSSRTRNKEQRGAKRLADNWLPGGSKLGQDRLKNLLNCLGFKVASVKPQTSIGKFEHYAVLTEKVKSGQRNSYTHPIAALGSGAALDGFRVVCINGAYDADAMIEIMKQIGNAKHTMILYDNALPLSERRRLARKTKNALGDKLFAVVDRVVMMFLVRNYDETKMNKMLVSLITPFGYYQPYVWESANVMPPEIFMGRKQELERIKSPTGVNIVYGGRQLGKSALLKKAKEDIDWDENGNRAVLVDIKGLDYKKAAKKIGHELYDAFVFDQDIDTEDWNELARTVRRRLQSDKNRIPYLLLLLDEADVFIDSCEAVNYQPFDALKEIQSIGAGRFKFVIAGLRNIVRFKREALGNNSVLTHLQTMTVKPFNTSEARELLEIPLHYLGLRFPKEKEYLITLILATTNYFPGLIQMYCAKLINAMRNKDYANYDEVDTPIYEVSEEHIKKVLADPEFTQQIREKYMITLKLDEDNYYYLIALLMAFLYHNNGYNEGYSAADIKNVGNELEIAKIANLDNTKLVSFMEELKELNVLRNTDETHYLFSRFTFFQLMGTRAEVDDRLEEYMGE
ncbi:MAG: hypothetical protein PUG98_09600 [Clostridium sp.]|nr:hypothetical protein [Clostridium sp.]